MAPESFGRRLPFAFLEDIKGRFKSTYGNKGATAQSYAMQSDFSRILQKQMVCKKSSRSVKEEGKMRRVKEGRRAKREGLF
jgi:vesicle-associated membrane protein 7